MLKRPRHAQTLFDDGAGPLDDVRESEPGAEAGASISQRTSSTYVDTKNAGISAVDAEVASESVHVRVGEFDFTEYDRMVEEEKARNPPLTVTHYQCVGEGTSRVFYVWVRGQRRWVMPDYVIIPEQMSELLADEESSRRTTNDGIIAEIYAFNVNTRKYRYVVWNERIAKPRYLEMVAQGMPDADGIWW